MPSLFETLRKEVNRRLYGESSRILIGEDYADLARVMEALLSRCGFEVKTAHDGRIILETARSFRPHFVLLDVKLPGLGGYEVARILRMEAGFQEAVFIAISAYRPAAQRDHVDPFDHYLVKPVELESLLPLLMPTRPSGR